MPLKMKATIRDKRMLIYTIVYPLIMAVAALLVSKFLLSKVERLNLDSWITTHCSTTH